MNKKKGGYLMYSSYDWRNDVRALTHGGKSTVGRHSPRYIAKIPVGGGKYRYFYDQAEYNSYLRGRAYRTGHLNSDTLAVRRGHSTAAYQFQEKANDYAARSKWRYTDTPEKYGKRRDLWYAKAKQEAGLAKHYQAAANYHSKQPKSFNEHLEAGKEWVQKMFKKFFK